MYIVVKYFVFFYGWNIFTRMFKFLGSDLFKVLVGVVANQLDSQIYSANIGENTSLFNRVSLCFVNSENKFLI